ncbi:MAG: AraC family transcriptional regulator [Prevotellaceae bacterium]|jgi:AraC-like DNA-binding protein|nr:AraC family transcriptional regulator [Prevotellaceae bacterium]
METTNIELRSDFTDEWLYAHQKPYRIEWGAFLFVTEGEVNLTVNLFEYHLKANDVVIILPGSIIYHRNKTTVFEVQLIAVKPQFIRDLQFIQAIVPYLETVKENPVVSLNDEEAAFFFDYFPLLKRAMSNNSNSSRMVESMLMAVLYGMAEVYHKNRNLSISPKVRRSNEIYRFLRQNIIKNYKQERKIGFYAEQTCVTAKHLTTAVKEASGRSVADLIASMVIADAKSQLKYSDKTIAQIADSLNFPDASFFGKYFKKHTGNSPKEYREGK